MNAIPTNRREMTALFFLAFFGLNFAGTVCFSHCNLIPYASPMILAASAVEEDRGSEHCDKKNPDDKVESVDDTLNLNKIKASEQCCDPASSMISVPISSGVDIVHTFTAEEPSDYCLPVFSPAWHGTVFSLPVYRPPPKHHRTHRNLNYVIRI